MSAKWPSSQVLVALSTALFLVSSVFAKCECGYAVKGQGTYTEAFEADFFHQDDVAHDKDWDVSNYLIEEKRPFTMKYDRKNVISNPISRSSGDPGLQLFVRGPTADNAPVSTAELMTTRRDMHYGSYRVALKYTQEPGTCGSMFWLETNTAALSKQEIDIELLSFKDTTSSPDTPINFVLHGTDDNNTGFASPNVTFHPSDGFHEYRFDWSPGKIDFYTDGQRRGTFTKGIPTNPGSILLNHWSSGNSWTNGPPVKDALMTVAYVKAYFNTTNTAAKCIDPEADGAVCEVPDQTGPISPDKATTFLNLNPPSDSQDTDAVPVNPPNPFDTNTPTDDQPNTHVPNPSPDNTCGGDRRYDCLANTVGECCSSHGYCGSSPAYCGEGCQQAFGKCNSGAYRRLARSRVNRYR